MHQLLLLSRLNDRALKSIQQVMRLQEVVVQGQHRGVDRETVERTTLVRQAVHASRLRTLERIAATAGSGPSGLQGLEARDLIVGARDLGRRVQALEDHVAMFEDMINEVLD